MIAALCAMFREFIAHHVDNFRRNHARLHDIFRCAELHRFCFFGFVTLIREYYLQDTLCKMFVGEYLEKREPVELRHRKIEEDDIGFEPLPQARERLLRRKTCLDRILVLGKLHPIHVQKELVVVNEKNRTFSCVCIIHTALVGGSSSRGTAVASAGAGTSWSASPASKSVLSPLTSENGTRLSNAFIIASSCIVSMPSLRAAAQSLESTGLSRTIFSMADDISSTSKTAIRPRKPVGHVAVRFASYTVLGILKRYFAGSDSSCVSIPLRCDAPSGTSLTASGPPNVRTRRCAIERMSTGGMR